jgi:hypothetical protein
MVGGAVGGAEGWDMGWLKGRYRYSLYVVDLVGKIKTSACRCLQCTTSDPGCLV